MTSVIVITIVLCSLIRVSIAQYVYEVYQPELLPEQCCYLDTYKTDFVPDARTVRSERSLLKKLLKDCVPCCQNNGGYNIGAPNSGYNNDYTEDDSGYDSGYSGPSINPGPHGHIYLPLPPPRQRLFPNLFNWPFRLGGMGKKKSMAPAPEPVYEEPAPVPPPAPTYEAPAPAYEVPAPAPAPAPVYEASKPVTEPKPTYSEKTNYESAEDMKPPAQQNYADSAESIEDQKNSYATKSSYKNDKKSSYNSKAQATPQMIQPIVYIYTIPSPPSTPTYSSPYEPPSYSLSVPSYSPPAPSYTPPASSYSPPATLYSPPATSYSPPVSSYTPTGPSYSPSPQEPLYTPPALSYSLPSPPAMVFPEASLKYSPLDSYSSLLNSPNYFKRTYSQSLTYLLPATESYASTPSYSYPDVDQPMRACPELFTSY